MPAFLVQKFGELPGAREARTDGVARYYRRKWLVAVSILNATPVDILKLPGLPRPYDPYVCEEDVDVGAVCVNLQARQKDDPNVWEVEADWSTDPLHSLDWLDLLPWERLPTLSYSTIDVEQALIEDVNHAAVANSAGMLFDPPAADVIHREVITVQRNELYFYEDTLSFKNTLNSDEWFGRPPGTCRMADVQSRQVDGEGQTYSQTTYRVEVDRRWRSPTADELDDESDPPVTVLSRIYYGWKLRLLDMGYMEKSGTTLRHILGVDGRPVTSPWFLDGAGAAQSFDDPDPVYLEFDVRKSRVWAPLQLPYPGYYDSATDPDASEFQF